MRISISILVLFTAFVLTNCGKNGDSDNGMPVASFSVSGYEVPVPCTISFYNNSRNATSYTWYFGDGTTSSDPNPTHYYNAIGSFFVKLKVTGPKGTDSVCKVVNLDQVADPAKSSFSYFMDKCTGTPVSISFRSLNPQSQYPAWDFGEGTTSPEANPIIRYNAPGNYTIKFSSQLFGRRDTIIRAISIN